MLYLYDNYKKESICLQICIAAQCLKVLSATGLCVGFYRTMRGSYRTMLKDVRPCYRTMRAILPDYA